MSNLYSTDDMFLLLDGVFHNINKCSVVLVKNTDEKKEVIDSICLIELAKGTFDHRYDEDQNK